MEVACGVCHIDLHSFVLFFVKSETAHGLATLTG